MLIWDVLSPALASGPGALSGNYIGASADVVAGVSAGANALVGEAACSFSRIALARRGVNGEIASARGARRRPIAPTALQRVVAE